EPPTFTVNGSLAIHLEIGVKASSPGAPFLIPGGTINLTVSASLSAATIKINLPLLEATISSATTISFSGNVNMTLVDPGASDDGKIDLAEIGSAAVTHTSSGTITSPATTPITLTADVRSGLKVGGSPLLHA